jgi:hypothetical protein
VTNPRRIASLVLLATLGCHGSAAGPHDASSDEGRLEASAVDRANDERDDTRAPDAPDAPDAANVTDGADAADATGIACGDAACAPGQICVHEYCGGGPAPCLDPEDGGVCWPTWTFDPGDICPATGHPGCWPPPCQNPPPHCADFPAACHGQLSCFCVPSTVCAPLPCAMASGTSIECAAQ